MGVTTTIITIKIITIKITKSREIFRTYQNDDFERQGGGGVCVCVCILVCVCACDEMSVSLCLRKRSGLLQDRVP